VNKIGILHNFASIHRFSSMSVQSVRERIRDLSKTENNLVRYVINFLSEIYTVRNRYLPFGCLTAVSREKYMNPRVMYPPPGRAFFWRGGCQSKVLWTFLKGYPPLLLYPPLYCTSSSLPDFGPEGEGQCGGGGIVGWVA